MQIFIYYLLFIPINLFISFIRKYKNIIILWYQPNSYLLTCLHTLAFQFYFNDFIFYLCLFIKENKLNLLFIIRKDTLRHMWFQYIKWNGVLPIVYYIIQRKIYACISFVEKQSKSILMTIKNITYVLYNM